MACLARNAWPQNVPPVVRGEFFLNKNGRSKPSLKWWTNMIETQNIMNWDIPKSVVKQAQHNENHRQSRKPIWTIHEKRIKQETVNWFHPMFSLESIQNQRAFGGWPQLEGGWGKRWTVETARCFKMIQRTSTWSHDLKVPKVPGLNLQKLDKWWLSSSSLPSWSACWYPTRMEYIV